MTQNDTSSPTPNLLNIRSFNDLIAMLYALFPVLTGMLMAYGILAEEDAALWAAVGTGACQLILQFARTQEGVRRAIYTALNLVNMVLIAYVAGWNPDNVTNLLPLLNVLLGGAPAIVAVQNVNTSGDETRYGKHAAKVD